MAKDCKDANALLVSDCQQLSERLRALSAQAISLDKTQWLSEIPESESAYPEKRRKKVIINYELFAEFMKAQSCSGLTFPNEHEKQVSGSWTVRTA